MPELSTGRARMTAPVASRLKARGTVVPALSFFSVTLVAATVAAARASLYFTEGAPR